MTSASSGDEPNHKMMDFDQRLQLMKINKAPIVQGLVDDLAALDKDYIDYNNPTIAMATKLYMEELYRYNSNKRSVNLYRYKIDLLAAKFSDVRLKDLGRKDAIEFMRDLKFKKE